MDIVKEHADRVRAADPLVAGHDQFAPGKEGERVLEAGSAVGVASVSRQDVESMNATWGPLVTYNLRAWVGGGDPEGDLERLLGRWTEVVAEDPEARGADRALTLTWPSRDTAVVGALVRQGFTPTTAIVVRKAGTAVPPHARDGVRIRAAVKDDLDVMAGLYLRLLEYDAQFGWLVVRPSTADRGRDHVAELLARENGWNWVAEKDGAVVGMITVEQPADAGWISPVVEGGPTAYLGIMYADPGIRGQGIGAALAATAHARIDGSGVAMTLLHHAVPNPLSTPFWARQGYRPLLTQWGKHL